MNDRAAHRGVLEEEDSDYLSRNWQASAEAYLEAAKSGEDISEDIPILAQAYRDCSQVPTLEPLAAAIVIDCVRRRDAAGLADVAQSTAYPEYFLKAMERCALQGIDVGPHISWMLRHADSGFTLSRILNAWIQNGKGNLAEVLRTLASSGSGQNFLPRFLKDADWKDSSDALAELKPVLGESKRRKDILSSLVWAAQAGASLSPIVPELRKCLNDSERETAEDAAYCLALHLARSEAPLGELMLHQAAGVRARAFAGAAFALRAKYSEVVFDELLRGLADPDESVRRKSLEYLKLFCSAAPPLSDSRRNLLREASRNPEAAREVLEFLFYYAEAQKDRRAVDAFAQSVPSLSSLLSPWTPICPVCESLPRNKEYSNESDVPPASKKLIELPPELSAGGGILLRCPECGTLYRYSASDETEDMVRSISIELERLSPYAAQSRARGDLQEQTKRELPGILEKAAANLDHPVRWQRAEAAWILASRAIAERTPELLDSLRMHDEAVRLEAASCASDAVRNPELAGLRSDLCSLLQRMLPDQSQFVRKLASGGLAYAFAESGRISELRTLLVSEDAVVVSAAAFETWLAFSRGSLRAPDLTDALLDGCSHADADVRRYCGYALKETGFPADASGRRAVDVWTRLLHDERTDLRADAADSLRSAAEAGEDISAALPRLMELLSDPEVAWHANQTIQKAVRQGMDGSSVLPALQDLIVKNESMRAELLETIRTLQESGIDLSPCAKGIAATLASPDCSYSALNLLQSLPIESASTVKEELRTAMHGKNFESFHEQCCALLTRILISENRMSEIESLLQDSRQIRGACTSALSPAALEEPERILRLVPSIALNLKINSAFLREGSISLLESLAAISRNAREEVIRALSGIDLPAAHDLRKRLAESE